MFQVLIGSIEGKRVRIPHGPATVIGELAARFHWPQWAGKGGRGDGAISQETCLEQRSLGLFEE